MFYLLEYDFIFIYCLKISGDILLGGIYKLMRYNNIGNKFWEIGKDMLGNIIYDKLVYIME